jgi:biotin operon repressor
MNLASADIQMMVGELAAAGLCGTGLTCALGYLRNTVWKHRQEPNHLHHI